MSLFLDGKVVVVTGGTKGIGRAIAAAVLAAGANVGICGRNGGAVARAVSDLQVGAPGGPGWWAQFVMLPTQIRFDLCSSLSIRNSTA